VITLKSILRGFEIASGLKINFHKSKLAGINVLKSNLDFYAKTLNCGQMGVPFNYLSLEVGGNPRKKKFWEPVLNKLKSRLSVWKGRFLSMAGRVCLIKFVLSAVPLYYLSLFKAPDVVCKSIIGIQRRFLWGWGKFKSSISWISWKELCKSKEEGGLGIRDIRKFNFALMAKWKWRYISNEKGRWKEMLESKYGMELNNGLVPMKYQSWWWRDFMSICREGGGEGWFQKEVGWKIGSGDKIRFWEDVWVGNSKLKTLFPRLFSLSLNQGHKVEEVGGWEGSMWRWTLSWRRARFEWETVMESELGDIISRVVVMKDENDALVWSSEANGCFTVSFAYECLGKTDRGPQIEAFRYLWKAKTFPNVMLTSWRVLLNRIPTRLCLRRRGVLLDTTECALCKTNEKLCQHLFLECKVACSVWSMFFRWIGVLFVKHNDVRVHFESFNLTQGSNKQNLIWKGVWATIVWCLWEQRNEVVFNQGVVDEEEVFQKAQLKSWLWLKHNRVNFNYSLSDWVLNPMVCISSYK